MASMFAQSPAPHTFMDSPNRSMGEQNQSGDINEDQWRALAKIVRDVGPNLLPDEELGDLAAAEAAVIAKDNDRAAVENRLKAERDALKEQHTRAAEAAQRPAGHPSAAEHDAQVRSIEQQQYTTGKQVNEEQALVAKREVELGQWKVEKEEIGKVTVGEEGWADGKIIRIKMFAEAGFSIIPPKDGAQHSKVLIRNDAKEDVHSVAVDKGRSKVFTANLIWSLAGE